MRLPLNYIIRNIYVRKITMILTAGGLALVVFVFSTVLMLDEGLKKTLVNTGERNNLISIRKGADTEIQSGVNREQAAIIESHPLITSTFNGTKLVSKESVVLISLTKKNVTQQSNVVVRGLSSVGFELRPRVRLVEGRKFRNGTNEIVIGSAIASQYKNAKVGSSLTFAKREWPIVGIIDAQKTAFDSEVWGNVNQIMQAFRRNTYSIMVFKITNKNTMQQIKRDFENDPRLSQEFRPEQNFYMDQSRALSKFIRILGLTLTVVFSIGAIIGAMITMNAAVANRTSEIGTLRALGFTRPAILSAFLLESIFLSILGGIIGICSSSLMEFSSFTTTNFQTFSDLSFGFTMTPLIAAQSFAIAIFMGSLGGMMPAIHASRLSIVDALRSY